MAVQEKSAPVLTELREKLVDCKEQLLPDHWKATHKSRLAALHNRDSTPLICSAVHVMLNTSQTGKS